MEGKDCGAQCWNHPFSSDTITLSTGTTYILYTIFLFITQVCENLFQGIRSTLKRICEEKIEEYKTKM